MLDPKTQLGSNFSLYLGIAVENKESDSLILKVQLREITPYISGKVEEMKESKATNNGSITLTNTINAEYFNVTTNRRYPPDVRKNEQVFVFKYGDTDKYYWCLLGRDDHLRNLERLNFSVSDNEESVKLWDNDNTYYFEMDTVKGHVLISTANSNDEEFRYIFKIDTANSKVTLCDDDENEITLDSTERRIYLTNKDGSIVDINKKTITLAAPDDIILRAGRQIVTDAPTTTVNQNTTGVIILNGDCLNATMGNTFNVTAPCIGLAGYVVANSIVAGPIQATSYSVGGTISFTTRSIVPNLSIGNYDPSMSIIQMGIGNAIQNTPNAGGGADANRHDTAWEQAHVAIEKLADAIDRIAIDPQHPPVDDLTSAARQLADESFMPLNRGY